ncbi:hypothetical protein [Yoonia sp. BS5-3]|uniref:Phospholipase A2 n=1 Tax=Yoonia phaeophyticola TaxID=3137369 RepID=A0ABZ2V9D2_9RHOB
MRSTIRQIRLVLALILCGSAGQAQDWDLMRWLEEPGHEALMSRIAEPGSALAPFETDGCSGGLSGAWRVVSARFPAFAAAHQAAPPWESCCVTHDRAYHNAGSAADISASFDARLAADRALEACVMATQATRRDELAATYNLTPDQIAWAYERIAGGMFAAVRLGGRPCTGLPWRWGYGYPACSGLGRLLE